MIYSRAYKIRNTKGFYSTGGLWPKFTVKGKTWKTLGHVKNHLTQIKKASKWSSTYRGCVIVEYQISTQEVGVQKVAEVAEVAEVAKKPKRIKKVAKNLKKGSKTPVFWDHHPLGYDCSGCHICLRGH